MMNAILHSHMGTVSLIILSISEKEEGVSWDLDTTPHYIDLWYNFYYK